jgi:hypothetical protein
MKKYLLLVFILYVGDIFACTTAIISGKYTKDGRPILWKHRDASEENNVIRYFNDSKYYYIGLVNASDTKGENVWAGCNEYGFAIMNSASYNLIEEDTIDFVDQEGVLMKKALGECKTLEDFENLLKTLPKPLGVQANFGVIDANGGAAYYETDQFKFTKIDVNDPKVAPFGYVIRTNYSFTGNPETGYGYIRYNTANKLLYNASACNNLTIEYIINNCSRSLYHSLTEQYLTDCISPSGFAQFQDYIPRTSSVASIIIHGINDVKNIKEMVMWSIVGFPLTSVAIPVFVFNKNKIPEVISPNNQSNSILCDYSLMLKNKLFPIKRGNGGNYIKVNELIDKDGSGILTKINTIENGLFELYNNKVKSNYGEKEINELYIMIDGYIKKEYKEKFGI